MKQTKLWLTTVVVLLCSLTASAHDFEVDGIYYKITSSTDLTVSVTYRGDNFISYRNEYSGVVTIPSTITFEDQTYGVTSIGTEAFAYCNSLTAISIPEGVTSLGYGVCHSCDSLTAIIIPEGVTSIGGSAFYDCSNLTSITIPEGVTSIGNYAFYGCSSLTSITIPEGVTSIVNYAFYGCSSLTSITIPEGVTSIGNYAFYGCSSLTSITIPESVTSIGESAFSGCSSLTSITIPEGVTSIGGSAFSGCSSLTSITIPESVTSIGNYAFDSTRWYNNRPDGVVYIGRVLYKYKGTMPANTSIEVKEGTVSISPCAFYGCSSLTFITIPESVERIGKSAFYGCGGELIVNCNIPSNGSFEYGAFYSGKFSKVTIGKNVTRIGDNAFYGCSSLTSIIIPESVTSIGRSAFYGCTGELIVNCNISSSSCVNSKFSKVFIGNKVTRIGDFAFDNCTSLKEVIFEDGSETLSLGFNKRAKDRYTGEGLFYDCPLESVYLGRDLNYSNKQEDGFSPFYHKDRSPEISLGNSITTIPSRLFYNNDSLSAILIIPESVTSIASYAFSGCTNLRVVVIPEEVTSLVASAFSSCSDLRVVVIPESVTSIDYWTFSGCSNIGLVVCNADVNINDHAGLSFADRVLKGEYLDGYIFSEQDGAYALTAYVGEDENLILPETYNGQGYSIGDYAFHYCPSLTSITIPDGITSIGYAAFSGTSLTSVEIPASVQSIARGVFCEYEKDDALLSAVSLRTVVARSHAPASLIDGAPVEEQDGGKNLIFSNYTYIHAPLYVPEGAYWDYAYAIGWGDFINIKEMVTEADNLQSSKAYMIADAEGCNYTVYDVEKKSLRNVAYTHSLDETREDCCWTVLREDGKTYLYSLGVKKFATISDKGSIALSDTPVSITITDDEKGLNVNGSNLMFVLNKNVKADVTVRTKYLVTFKIGNEVIAADSLEYGTAIVAPEVPEREGYTFDGWEGIAETVPAEDVTYYGSYSVNSYLLTYVVDGETIQSDSVAYGTAIVALEEPTKEGYTFSGWSDVPATMPAEELVVSGFFTVNIYKVYYYVGDALVHTAEVAYGEAIPEYVYEPTAEGDVFVGWVGETYETMPAHDVAYRANITNEIEEVEFRIQNSEFIYDLTGRRIINTEKLKGVYIVNGKKVMLK